ncbi:MAG TPA: cell division protein FtsQ/DivIB, partial [Xanthomonadales bacterium]|nr:cell division protein FtsQ/DivIB [Xanthomonadales bacterium]
LPRLAGPEDRALEVLEFYGRAREVLAGSGHDPAGAALSRRGSWSIALDNGARIVVGREAPQARLARFVDTLPRIAASQQDVWVRADLRYANGYALEWRTPALEAPAPQTVPTDAPTATPPPGLAPQT